MRIKKLLFCIINMNRAGAQRVLVNLLNNLDLGKYDITVLALSEYGDLNTELDKRIHYKTVVGCKNKFFRFLLSYLLRRIIPLRFVASLLIRENFDYEIAFLEGECTRFIAAHKVSKEKKIAWVHTNLLVNNGSLNLYHSKYDEISTYEQYGHIVCVSEGVRSAFIRHLGDIGDVSVCYNVVDEKEIRSKSNLPVSPWRGNGFNILMVGNLRKEKAYVRMLSICDRLRKEGLVFTVTILGSGPEFNEINEIRTSRGLQDVVHLLGSIRNPYPYMKNADVLVCSSFEEGFSTVVIEALILGLPTITTACSGMSEILDNGKYGIITENDEMALFNTLKKVIQSPKILNQYRESLNERVAFFSAERRVGEIEKLFR